MTITRPIPDGYATFRSIDEMSTAASRRIALATNKIDPDVVAALADAVDAGDDDGAAVRLHVKDADLEAQWAWADELIGALFVDWSLERPAPHNRDELGELPANLYGALSSAVAEIYAEGVKRATPARAATKRAPRKAT